MFGRSVGVRAVYYGKADIKMLPGQATWIRIVQENDLDAAVVVERLKKAGGSLASWWETPRGVHERLATFLHRTKTPLVQCSGDRCAGYGVACQDAQVSDKVCLIAGTSLPVILLPAPGGFQVVGPAFIGGLMDGKVWEDAGPTATAILLR
jgi:hypothetical protein